MTKRKKRTPIRRKLRKQPKTKRVKSKGVAAVMPAIRSRPEMPRSSQERRSNQRRLRFAAPVAAIRNFVFSTRWISLAILLVCGYALYAIAVDSRYRLSNVPVGGATMLPAHEILQASGLTGVHIFSANPNQAAAQINELPGVISATVTLSWPNQAAIAIKEDTPLALWHQDGKQYWVNEGGQLVEASRNIPDLVHIEAEYLPEELPLPSLADDSHTGEELEEAVENPISGPGFVSQEILAGALELRQLYPEVERFYYRPSGGLSFDDVRGGWRAYFGVSADMKQKQAIYETLVENLQAANLTLSYISVSNKNKPYYQAVSNNG